MTEEEKKEFLRTKSKYAQTWLDDFDMDFLINLVEKLQKEVEKLQKENENFEKLNKDYSYSVDIVRENTRLRRQAFDLELENKKLKNTELKQAKIKYLEIEILNEKLQEKNEQLRTEVNSLKQENEKLKNTDLKQAKIEYLEVLNEKLQKENEELKIKNNAIKRESEAYAEHMIRLDNELNLEKEKSKYEWIRQNCLPQELVNKLYIPTQKVKDEIKELDKRIKNPEKISYWASYTTSECIGIRSILQKLLEETEK